MKDLYMLHKIIFLFVSFLFIACYSIAAPEKRSGFEIAAAVPQSPVPQVPRKTLSAPAVVLPASATPGEYVTVVYTASGADGQKLKANLYQANGKRLASAWLFDYMLEDGHKVKAALIAPPSTCAAGKAFIKIESGDKTLAELPFEIIDRQFVAEVIPLNPGNTSLRTEPDPRKTAESERLWAILSTTGSNIWTAGNFIPPVPAETRRSSFFGDRRVYQYSTGKTDTSVHAGIDYAVPKGTQVQACAAGKVVLACPRIVTGNSIIIEHLPGVYSIYYHLEEIKVAEGSMVNAGDIIGLSGSTGLSTGPHLHWEIRVSTENADPDAFIRRAMLDRAAISDAIFVER